MALRLVQVGTDTGERFVAAFGEDLPDTARTEIQTAAAGPGSDLRILAIRLAGASSLYELASAALRNHTTLREEVRKRLTKQMIDLSTPSGALRLLAPIDHPDAAHLHLTGTGLTHLGSAEGRDKMHAIAAAGGTMTDSMRMFLDGLKGGKPPGGAVGSQPEWFFKGDGSSVVGTDQPLEMPAFARDGGEEPEIAGIYLIDDAGVPRRLGFCLANEFSDHITERENYLWLAHSKLRQAALGPEVLTGPLPQDVRGTSRILRDGELIWEKPFLTGEINMSHWIANLEHHHFKYEAFRRPGDVHVHFFGTATLSFSDGFATKEGDVFELRADAFRLPLRNWLTRGPARTFSVVPL